MESGFWKYAKSMRGLIISVLAFALLLTLTVGMVEGVDRRAGENQLALVRGAAYRATLTCYAVEGRYPRSLDYLCKHYGLLYDRERFLVSYDAFASNVMPQIVVTERGTGA